MKDSTTGIKLANGEYYEIIPAGDKHKKKLVLTTATDKQTSVQIDLFSWNDENPDAKQYIGSLVIENIEPAGKKEPEIEMLLSIDEEGVLQASAHDAKSGEKQSLSVSLESQDEDSLYDIPEFEINEPVPPPLPQGSTEVSDSQDFDDFTDEPIEEEPKRPNILLIIAFILLSLALIAAVVLVVTMFLGNPQKKEPLPQNNANTGQQETTAPVDEDAELSKNAPRDDAPDTMMTDPQNDSEQPDQSDIQPDEETQTTSAEDDQITAAGEQGQKKEASGSVSYQIKWGDTLWDLSNSFYRTPWKYGDIARANGIKNPNKIYANTEILIPEE